MKIEISDDELDEKMKQFLQEQVVKPLANKLGDYRMTELYIDAAIRECLNENMKKSVAVAINDFLGSQAVKNRLIAQLEESIRSEMHSTTIKYLEENIRDKLSSVNDILTELNMRKEESKLDLVKIFNGIHTIGNCSFEVIVSNEKVGNYETFVKEYLIKKNPRLWIEPFGCYSWQKNWEQWQDLRDASDEDRIKLIEKNKIFREITKEKCTGAPDFIVKDGNLIYFVEVKGNGDGIRREQIMWAKNHPDFLVKYIFVKDNARQGDI